MRKLIFTIGHSNHSIARLTDLLHLHRITAVADVRSRPYSRFNPQFNRETLQQELKNHRIAYVFLGRELGARSEDTSCYIDGKVQYERLARTALFREGVERLVRGSDIHRIALMCAEKDPLTCHRTILVCRHLPAQQFDIQHILEDGKLESHEQALGRLLREQGESEGDLFRPRDEIIERALDLRGQEVAYTQKDPDLQRPQGTIGQ